jgi:hypothetical protein
VLLSPVTAQLIAGAMAGQSVPHAFDSKRLLATSTASEAV